LPNNHSINSESEITLGLLKAVHEDDKLTQRSAANELDIALGLVNTYLKRCVKKGFIKIRQVPRKRYAYYLTPQGFAEKCRLTADFLSQSLSLFRQSQTQYREIFSLCAEKNWHNVAFYGAGDLSEIANLCAQEFPIKVVAIIQSGVNHNNETRLPIVESIDSAGEIDAIILTDLLDPQYSFEKAAKTFSKEQILTPKFLEISRNPPMLKD
jgi:DNA-binding MarR family transcriptional regulator